MMINCKVYDSITAAFASAYVPGKEVVIDEGMIRWFGCGFKTYLPSKRAKYGIKAYKVCDKSGYNSNSSYTSDTRNTRIYSIRSCI